MAYSDTYPEKVPTMTPGMSEADFEGAVNGYWSRMNQWYAAGGASGVPDAGIKSNVVYSDAVKPNLLPAQLDPSDSSTGTAPQATANNYGKKQAQIGTTGDQAGDMTGTGGNSPTGFVGTTAPGILEKIGTAGIIGVIALIVIVLLVVSGLRGSTRSYGVN